MNTTRILTLIAALSISSAPPPAAAVILFQNSGTTTGWDKIEGETFGDVPIQVTAPSFEGDSKAIKYHRWFNWDSPGAHSQTGGNKNHSEVWKFDLGVKGAVRWYGWAFYIPTTTIYGEGFSLHQTIGLYPDGWSPNLLVEVRPDGSLALWTRNGAPMTSSLVRTQITPEGQALAKGVWHRIVIYADYRYTGGQFKIWVDNSNAGSPTATFNGQTCFDSPVSFDFRFGMYTTGYKDGTCLPECDDRVFYEDCFKVADTNGTGFNDVYPNGTPVASVSPPSFNPNGGVFTTSQTVSMFSSTSGASIRYTTNGSTPSSTSGTLYSSPIVISATTTLKAIAFKSGMSDSSITSATWTINPAGSGDLSSSTWKNFLISPAQTGSFTAECDVTPNGTGINDAVTLADGAPDAWTANACIVRFMGGGISAYHGTSYTPSLQSFAAGTTYHVRMFVNAPARTYTVGIGSNIYPSTGSYSFRSTESTPNGISHWGLYADPASNTGQGIWMANRRISGATLISENFSVSPVNFTVVRGGAWAVSGGKYVLTSPAAGTSGNGNISVYNVPVSGNWTLTVEGSATPTGTTWDDISVIFGYQDTSNYYYASFNESNDNGTSGIFKVAAGTVTQIADITSLISGGSNNFVKIVKSGSSYSVYRNSTSPAATLAAAATDSTFSTGKIGFGTFNDGATFDNLLVTSP